MGIVAKCTMNTANPIGNGAKTYKDKHTQKASYKSMKNIQKIYVCLKNHFQNLWEIFKRFNFVSNYTNPFVNLWNIFKRFQLFLQVTQTHCKPMKYSKDFNFVRNYKNPLWTLTYENFFKDYNFVLANHTNPSCKTGLKCFTNRDVRVTCASLRVSGGEDSVDQDECANNLSSKSSSGAVTVSDGVRSTSETVVWSHHKGLNETNSTNSS